MGKKLRSGKKKSRRDAELDSKNADLDSIAADLDSMEADLDGKAADLEGKAGDLGTTSADLGTTSADLVDKSTNLGDISADLNLAADLVFKSRDLNSKGADSTTKIVNLDRSNADLDINGQLLKESNMAAMGASASSTPNQVNINLIAAGNICSSHMETCSSSPSVSRTLGDEDSVESRMANQTGAGINSVNAAVHQEQVCSPKANTSWAGLFHSNRELKDNLILSDLPSDMADITLDSDDIDVIEESWGFGLIGYVAGKFPGRMAIDQCCRSWGVKFQLIFHSSGWLLFKFTSQVDRDFVMQKGPYYIYGRPLLLKVIPEMFNFNDCEISKVPIWIQLPNLPLELWNVRALSKIASKLGTPKQADKLTISRERVSYARVLVEVDITQALKEDVCIIVPNGKKFEQVVRYEFVPKFCTACKAIGHSHDRCPYSKPAGPSSKAAGPSSKAAGPSSKAAGPAKNSSKSGTVSVAKQPQSKTAASQQPKHVAVSGQTGLTLANNSRSKPIQPSSVPAIATSPDQLPENNEVSVPSPGIVIVHQSTTADVLEEGFTEVSRKIKAKGKLNQETTNTSIQPLSSSIPSRKGKEKIATKNIKAQGKKGNTLPTKP